MAKATKPVWILCPRCELNYIKKADQYCNVCKKELKLIKTSDDDIGDLELCPICKINFVQNDEEVCDSCKQELGIVVDEETEDREVADWHKYIADDDDEEDDEDDDGYQTEDMEDTTGISDDFEFDDELAKDLDEDGDGELDLDMMDDEDFDDDFDDEDEDDDDEDDDEDDDDL